MYVAILFRIFFQLFWKTQHSTCEYKFSLVTESNWLYFLSAKGTTKQTLLSTNTWTSTLLLLKNFFLRKSKYICVFKQRVDLSLFYKCGKANSHSSCISWICCVEKLVNSWFFCLSFSCSFFWLLFFYRIILITV